MSIPEDEQLRAGVSGSFALGRVAPVGASALLTAAFLFVLFVGGGYPGATSAAARVTTQILVLLTLSGWLVVAVRDVRWFPRSQLVGPGAIALALMAVCALFSVSPRMSLGGVAFSAVALAILVFVEQLAVSPFFRPRLRALLVAVPAVVSVAYIGQVVFGWVEYWHLAGGLALPPLRPDWAGLTFGSPNLVATVLLLAGPLALAAVATGGPRNRRRVAAITILAALAVVAIALTGSRGGALGLAGVMALGGAFAILRFRRIPRGLLAVTAVSMISLLAALLVVLLARGGQGGEGVRLDLWRTALAIFVDHPVTGGGPDTWAMLKLTEARPFVPTFVVHHAHNLYLWTLAELGILGSAGVAVLAGAVLVLLFRRARSSETIVAFTAIAVLAALAGLATQSLVDVVTNLPAIVLLVAVVVGYGLHAGRETEEAAEPRAHGPARRSAGLLVAGSLGIAVLGIGFVREDLAVAAATRADAMLLVGDAGEAAAGFADAYGLDPVPLYQAETGLAWAFANDATAASVSVNAVIGVDGLAHHLILDAYLRLHQGDTAGAIASARVAMDRGWPDAGVMLNAGRIGEKAGDPGLAEDGLVLAAALAPTSLGDPYWRAADRPLSYEDLVRRAAVAAQEHIGSGQAILVLGFGGMPGAAMDLIAGLAPVDQARSAAIVASRNAPSSGILTLRELLDADPADWVTAAWLSRMEQDAGDVRAASDHARWAQIVQGDSAPGLLRLPRRVAGDRDLPQFRLPGWYPQAVYKVAGSGLLFGPGSVTLVP
jgi:O-antigen ligase